MAYLYEKLPHAGIQKLAPYVPGKSIESLAKEQGLTEIIKLASNENPLGCSPKIREALQTTPLEDWSKYHITSEQPLRQILAEKCGLTKDNVFISNGSDAIFNLLLVCFALHTQKHILTHQYAFIQYEIQAHTLGVPVRHVPVRQDFSVDIQALIDATTEDTALIFLANPNNPTGLFIPHEEIDHLATHIPKSTLLVLDEAYFEYLPETLQADSKARLAKHPNLILTRTFSKAYGLAALRLGYALAHATIIELLYRIQLPFFVNLAVLNAAQIALTDIDFLQKTLTTNTQGKQQLATGFETLPIKQLPSFGNFITISSEYPAQILDQCLQKAGILVRPLSPYGLKNHLRVTIGTPAENARLLNALSYCLNLNSTVKLDQKEFL